MRSLLVAVLTTASIGLAGTASAAPNATITNGSLLQQIQYGYGGGGYHGGGGYGYHRRCYRERVCDYYGYCYYVRRCY